MKVKLSEIIPAAMLTTHREHVETFLAQEGIVAAPDLGETIMTERQVKELLEELADAAR